MTDFHNKPTLFYSRKSGTHYYLAQESCFTASDFQEEEALEHYFSHICDESVSANSEISPNAAEHYLAVQSCGHFICSSGYFCERKGLSSFLIIYTLSGEGQLTYRQNSYPLSKGSCFFINCKEYHRYETKNEWDFFYIHFYGKEAEYFYQQTLSPEFHLLTIPPTIELDLSIYQLLGILQHPPYHKELLVHNAITNILTDLILISQKETSCPPSYILKTQQYINEHFSEKISLDDISSHVNVSKYYLSREFKRYTNLTVQEYLTQRRIGNAKHLLLFSSRSVEEIAVLCGIPTTSHFIKVFRESEHMTPYQYKKSWSGLSAPKETP